MKFKGRMFESFKNPPAPLSDWKREKIQTEKNRALPEGKMWLHHDAKRSRIRRLKQLCRPILSSTDPTALEMIQKTHAKVTDGPMHEYGFLMIINQAREVSESNNLDWVVSLDYILSQLPEPETGSTTT